MENNVPTYRALQKFYNGMKNWAKITSHLDVSDEGFEKLLEKFCEETKFRVDGRKII